MIHRPELSVCLDDLRLDVKEAMDRARRMGFRAIDASALRGPLSPEELSRTGRRHLLKHLADLGLRLGSLRGPVGAGGYADPATGERRLERMRQIIALAAEIGTPVVSTTLGLAAGVREDDAATRIREALALLADDADRAGVYVAVETGGVRTSRLAEWVASINCPKLAIGCDTGALIMRGEDPGNVSRPCAGRIRLVRARDARAGTETEPGEEVTPGTGQLDAPRLLADLDECGFGGDLVLTRTGGSSPTDDLLRMKQQFEKYLARP